MKTLFITHLWGHLANRLINLSYWFALAEVYNYAVVPCVFGWEMDFVGTRKHLFSRYVLLHSAARMAKHVNINLDQHGEAAFLITEALESGRNVSIHLVGWLPRSLWHELPAEKLRRYFSPTKRHLVEARRVCEKARGETHPLVGVHIRHGDFASHDGGRWFLSLDAVVANMRYMQGLYPSVSFLVCSDAKFNISDFAGLDVTFGPGNVVSDLASLALCDFVLKPALSTFSLWAAWWGETPSIVMQKIPQFQINDFQVPILDPFADSNS